MRERRNAKGERRKEKGERRKEKGERRKEKGERRKEKGDRRKEKGERREKDGEETIPVPIPPKIHAFPSRSINAADPCLPPTSPISPIGTGYASAGLLVFLNKNNKK
jgi:hypothetical protein